MRPTAAALVVALALVTPCGASAYRTLADDPELMSSEPITWAEPIVAMELAPAGLPPARLAALADSLEQASDTIAHPACSAFRVRIDRTGTGSAQPGDGRNTIEWIASGWSRRGLEPDVAGVTDVLIRREEGRVTIVEADLYLNGEVAWIGIDGATDGASLSSAVQHELLHVAGLQHPCRLDGIEDAPLCSSNEELFRSSILFPIHELGAPQLGPDDVLGLCALYPTRSCASAVCDAGLACVDGACRAPEDVIACGAALDCSQCGLDAECAADRICVQGACRAPANLGASCDADAECASGLCADRRCSTACSEHVDCPEGYDCVAEGWCRVGRMSREACDTSDDCASGLCLGSRDGAACTSACRDASQCLAGEECRSVDHAVVCVPLPVAGCTATPQQAGRPWTWALIGLAWLLARRHQVARRLDARRARGEIRDAK